MPNEQLVVHIRDEFSRGTDRATVVRALANAGWKAEDINAAISIVEPSRDRIVPTPTSATPTTPTIGSATKTMVQNTASGLFIACIFILTLASILGVWKIFSSDVITKSFETLGVLAFVAAVVILASRFVGDPATVALPSPAFRPVRNITLGTLIVSSVLLAFFGVLSIWDVITDKDVLAKTLSSLAIIAFSSLIAVMVCLEREQNQVWKKRSGQISGGAFVVGVLFLWMMLALLN